MDWKTDCSDVNTTQRDLLSQCNPCQNPNEVFAEIEKLGTSLDVQRLGLHAANAGDLCSNPDQETRSYMPQLKNLHVEMKTWCSQISFFK